MRLTVKDPVVATRLYSTVGLVTSRRHPARTSAHAAKVIRTPKQLSKYTLLISDVARGSARVTRHRRTT